MEKKWDTVIPADLKRLFGKWEIYVPMVTKGLTHNSSQHAGCKNRRLEHVMMSRMTQDYCLLNSGVTDEQSVNDSNFR